MAWTFRKRKKLFSGVRLNYGSSGLSLNLGVPGASLTVGADGLYVNAGLPGTGIRNRQKITSFSEAQKVGDLQITKKDIERAGCLRNILYFVAYTFSYAIISILWIITGYIYSTENNYYLISGIFAVIFVINTIRLHINHHRGNISSSLIIPIILTIVLIIFFSLSALAFYIENEPTFWSLFAVLDLILLANLFACFKYRVKKRNRDAQMTEIMSSTTNVTSVQTPKTKSGNTTPIYKTPSFDYTKEGVLFFSQARVRNELARTYSTELINICAYIVRTEKCVLSDIQAELGISYQKVLESVKVLEKARIVKAEGNRRKVMVTDETIAIRLLLRYAKEYNSFH